MDKVSHRINRSLLKEFTKETHIQAYNLRYPVTHEVSCGVVTEMEVEYFV